MKNFMKAQADILACFSACMSALMMAYPIGMEIVDDGTVSYYHYFSTVPRTDGNYYPMLIAVCTSVMALMSIIRIFAKSHRAPWYELVSAIGILFGTLSPLYMVSMASKYPVWAVAYIPTALTVAAVVSMTAGVYFKEKRL